VVALAAIAITITACTDRDPVMPGSPEKEAPRFDRTIGVVEVTISGIGSEQPSSSVLSAASVAELASLRATEPHAIGGGASLDLLPPAMTVGGDGTIQLEPVSTGSFTEGDRANGGVRYVWANYRVRNAQKDKTAYDTERKNLTFLAVATDGTLAESAISNLRLFNNSNANAAIAVQILPTGAVTRDLLTNEIVSAGPDVLQVLSEQEAGEVARPAGVRDIFPYGFVVRRAGNPTTRTLPASPAADQFDGVVTFAFKIPLQAKASDDPFTISFMALAVDDDETRITQSLEEQHAAGPAAFEARAAALGASRVNLLPGGGYGGPTPSRLFCAARTAGDAGAPVAYLGRLESALVALSPSPRAAEARRISATTTISAHFDCPVDGVTPGNFTVRGLQSGQAFRGQAYAGNGTTSITTPAASFFAGEEVEVVATSAIHGLKAPYVGRLRVGAGTADAVFTMWTSFVSTLDLFDVAPADLNGDGKLDLLFASNNEPGLVKVAINNGDMSAPTIRNISVPMRSAAVAAGDLNGDGKLDIISVGGNQVTVRLGNGDGTFTNGQDYSIGSGTLSVALGDLDGDGDLDIVTGNLSVLLGNGDGTFQAEVRYGTDNFPTTAKLADLDGDGRLDLVAVNHLEHTIDLRFGDGHGGFGAATRIAVGMNPIDVVAADLDADGALDLAVANSWAPEAKTVESTISILIGNGDGTFQDQVETAIEGQHYARRLAVGDLNGDGHLDLATANSTSNTVMVLKNDGKGSFLPNSYVTVYSPIALALGDFNSDGTLDIVSGPSYLTNDSKNVVVFFNY
jgi:hypothetical protein